MAYKFVDEVTVLVRSGKGGAGCVAFRREKYVPFGGPNGGNGGRGGDVVVRAEPQMSTLLDYRFRPRHLAKNGAPGEGMSCTGRDGEPAVLKVPVGTVVYDVESGALLGDMTTPGQELVLCQGGRGGKGNEHFKSSTYQAPRFAQPGEPGQEMRVRFELKLLADVGLVGFPNVGKSSLIARVSAAKPKIADYPFTTLVPNLGMVQFGDSDHFVVADVPGLIVNASQGAGLGTRFLRHVERVRRIVHMVTVNPDVDDRDPIADFEAIEKEIAAHNTNLAKVPRVLVLNRVDLDFTAADVARVEAYAKAQQLPFFAISAVTGAGVRELVNHLGTAVMRDRDAQVQQAQVSVMVPGADAGAGAGEPAAIAAFTQDAPPRLAGSSPTDELTEEQAQRQAAAERARIEALMQGAEQTQPG